MIQLYLLVLIIIFIVIFFTIKEHFQSESIINCDKGKQTVIEWVKEDDQNGSYLYGCNTLIKPDENKPSKLAIKLFWNKDKIGTRTIVIVNTEDKDDTFIKDIITDRIVTVSKNNEDGKGNENQTNIYSTTLSDNIIENKTYFITVNYIEDDVIHVSNTLKITAISPTPHFESSGASLEKQNLMSLLRNKTFDIYL